MRVLILPITSISVLVHRNHLCEEASGLQIVARRSDERPALTTCDVESAPSFRLLDRTSSRGRQGHATTRVLAAPHMVFAARSSPPPMPACFHNAGERLRRF